MSLSHISIAQTINCAGAPQSRLVVGEQAQIIADGGSNLRVRPSADAILLTVIPQSAIIPVMDGPFCSGGYTWWQVDYDGERGWLAEGVDEFYWIAPYIIQRAQIDTIRIEIQPRLVDSITLQRLPEPPRSQFVLEGYPIQSNQIIPFIVIFDEPPTEQVIADEAITQLESLANGQRFIEIRIDDIAQSGSDVSLIYRFTVTTEDNRFVDAYLPVTVPELPLPYTPPEEEAEAETYLIEYFNIMTSALSELPADAFSPSLTDLDNMILSLQYNAPSEMSDTLRFQQNGIQFDYHPHLATEVVETLVENDSLPRHIALQFRDYPDGEGLIRIYRTEDVSSNIVLTLQQIIQRHPASPPQIPVPSYLEPPSARDDLNYMSFLNGDGVRYLAIFDTLTYSYQGLSVDGVYYISALFHVDTETDLALLDNLILSLQIGG